MINLLSPTDKKEFSAGRVNAILLRYLWFTGGLLGLLLVMSGLTYVVLGSAKQQAEADQKENSVKYAQYQPIQVRATQFQANLQTAKTILDQQTNYSAVLLKIARLLPIGTTLNNITLDSSTYGTPMELQIHARNEQAAVAAKDSFQNSSLFTNVQFKSLTISEAPQGTGYPVTATITATINKEAAK